MPVVWVPALLLDLSHGQTRVTVPGSSVRQVIENLDELYPGFKNRLLDGDRLRPNIAVAVDGQVSPQRLRHPLVETSEVHFLPAISGGGEVVLLRDVIQEDLPIFCAHQLDPEAARMAAFTSRDQQAFTAHWAKILADDNVDKKTILFDGQVVGNIVSFEVMGEREVGYWIGKEYWGKGIATRALTEFLKLVKVRPLYAHAAKHNLGSLRVLEKCGFTRIAEDKIYSTAHGADVEEFILILSS